MSRTPQRRLIACILMSVLWGAILVTGPTATAQIPRSNKDASFEDQFWKYIVGNNYKNWSPGFSPSAGFYKGANPHGAYLKMYINRTAAGNIDDLALGSVVILENYLADQSLKTISVMYRTAGFNPDGNDWYWIEYRPDGSVVPSPANADVNNNSNEGMIRNVSLTVSPKRMVIGKTSNCIGCHQSAAGDDFVFSNDRFQTPLQKIAEKVATEDALGKAPGQVYAFGKAPGQVLEEDSGEAFDLIADADADADKFFGSH